MVGDFHKIFIFTKIMILKNSEIVNWLIAQVTFLEKSRQSKLSRIKQQQKNICCKPCLGPEVAAEDNGFLSK